jgi:hypothetical protein
MAKRVTITATAVPMILADLADAAKLGNETPPIVSCICSAVANLIAASGQQGSSEQQAMMDAAVTAGFAPEFYGNGIRVAYFTKDRKSATFGRGQKTSAS